ncbi:hypothetical protein [Geopseudomonas aromaticivorans]
MTKMLNDQAGESSLVGNGGEIFAKARFGVAERTVLQASIRDGRLSKLVLNIPSANPTLAELRKLAATLNEFADAVEAQVNDSPVPATARALKRNPQRAASAEVLWTVGRFPNGDWTSGGTPKDETYAECEVFQVMASSREQAVRKAQSRRSAATRKARKAAEGGV